jgi:pimeloyl-ACP methyl ester carboxylesterase
MAADDELARDLLAPDRFDVNIVDIRGTHIAYARAGNGGVPLLLVHGWPETKRIWWRNVDALAAAGFDVIVPDLRGFGDSGPAPDGFYDVAASAEDLFALVSDVLGLSSCVACGGDFGGVVLQDLSLRHPGFVERQVLFNTIPPFIDDYAGAGIDPVDFFGLEHFDRHGQHAAELMLELTTPKLRRAYVDTFHANGYWAGPDAFTAAERAFMVEPFGDEQTFRSSLALYEYAFGREPSSPPLLFEKNPTTTLALYGTEDGAVGPAFVECMAVAFPNLVGPFAILRTGHFLQWEAADLLNRSLVWFCRDLVAAR